MWSQSRGVGVVESESPESESLESESIWSRYSGLGVGVGVGVGQMPTPHPWFTIPSTKISDIEKKFKEINIKKLLAQI